MHGYQPPSRIVQWLRRLLVLVIGLVVVSVVAILIGGFVFSGSGYSGPKSDHFDGKRFKNRKEVAHGGFVDLVKWQWQRKPPEWEVRETMPGPKPVERVGRGELKVTFVNHATVLIQQDGLNILTDPVWSDVVSPVRFIGFRRKHSAGLRFEDLPPIDAVIISHNHYDHLDMPTIKRLAKEKMPRFFVGLGNSDFFVSAGVGAVTEVDWWGTAPLSPEVELIGVPAQHFSNRGLFDRDRALWLGYAIRGPAGTTYFAGDTGAGPHFEEIKGKIGSPRLAILPIGAYEPSWFMSSVHLNPAEALSAFDTLGASTGLGIHYGTFALADDAQDQPLDALKAALDSRRDKPRFWTLGFGEGRDVPAGGTATPVAAAPAADGEAKPESAPGAPGDKAVAAAGDKAAPAAGDKAAPAAGDEAGAAPAAAAKAAPAEKPAPAAAPAAAGKAAGRKSRAR